MVRNKLLKRISAALGNNRGETLMESIVSILVFSILMAAITVTISASLRITAFAVREARNMQNAANRVLAESTCDGEGDGCDTGVISFAGIDIGVVFAKGEEYNFVSFAPGQCSCN
jgi:membrane-bound ClpP family serine protease